MGPFERVQRGIEEAYENDAERGWYSFVSLADVEELLREHEQLTKYLVYVESVIREAADKLAEKSDRTKPPNHG